MLLSRKLYHIRMAIPAFSALTSKTCTHSSGSYSVPLENSVLPLLFPHLSLGSSLLFCRRPPVTSALIFFSHRMFLSQPQGIRHRVPCVLSECVRRYSHYHSCSFCVISILGVNAMSNIYCFMLNTGGKKSFFVQYCFPKKYLFKDRLRNLNSVSPSYV